MMNDRRNVLKLLGLTGAASALVSTEAIAEPTKDGVPNMMFRGIERQMMYAESLERLARGIRDGSVAVTEMNVHSSIPREGAFLEHTLNFSMEILQDQTS